MTDKMSGHKRQADTMKRCCNTRTVVVNQRPERNQLEEKQEDLFHFPVSEVVSAGKDYRLVKIAVPRGW